MPAREVFFAPAQTKETSGSYTQIMIDECKKIGMKPVCDHKNYCKNDGNAIYIGQDHHVAHRGHRYNNKYFPSGWSEIKKTFDNMCMYTKNHGGHAKALCQNGGGSCLEDAGTEQQVHVCWAQGSRCNVNGVSAILLAVCAWLPTFQEAWEAVWTVCKLPQEL